MFFLLLGLEKCFFILGPSYFDFDNSFEARSELIESLEQAGPYGAGNPLPRFAFAKVKLVRADRVGDGDHVRCILAGDGGVRLKGIAFRVADQPLGQALLGAKNLHIAGSLRHNNWGGRQEVQLNIDDVAYPVGG